MRILASETARAAPSRPPHDGVFPLGGDGALSLAETFYATLAPSRPPRASASPSVQGGGRMNILFSLRQLKRCN